MKKNILYIILCFSINFMCYSQFVGVNTLNPTVLFDVRAKTTTASPEHGITFPVLKASPSGMTSSQNGMMTYFSSSGEISNISSLGEGFYFYYGNRFYPIVSSNNINTNLNAAYLESVTGSGGVNTLHKITNNLGGEVNGVHTIYYKMNLLLMQSYDPGIIVENYTNGEIIYSSVKINSSGKYNIIINSNISKTAKDLIGGGTSTVTLELVKNNTILISTGVSAPTVEKNKRVLSANINFIADLSNNDHLYLRVKVRTSGDNSNYNLEYPIAFTLFKLN